VAVVSGERHVSFEACFNFRDIGGYATSEGRVVRWGAVYRSGSLHRLTAADREVTAELGVRTVIDLRSTGELERDGWFGGSDVVRHHHVPLEDASDAKVRERESGVRGLGEAYVEIANAGRAGVGNALRLVAEREHPVVVHCFAGKDRTGIVAALLLSILGVPDATITDDYQLSEHSLAPSIAWANDNDRAWAALMASLPPSVLAAPPTAVPQFLGALREQYGSIDEYLLGAGLGREVLDLLRARLLRSPVSECGESVRSGRASESRVERD
jgi:protein-tyrosine phosphatase